MSEESANGPGENEQDGAFSPKSRQRAARRRRLSRRIRVLAAIVLALVAGLFLFVYSKFFRRGNGKSGGPPTSADEAAVDKEEHRKGMPVRDFIVE